jgi:2',3'-cyclic-nucleotide 2'-phosphodiesterase
MPASFKALMLGDVIGDSGIHAVQLRLPALVRDLEADLVIANGENASGGFGLTEDNARQLFSAGVDVLTGGNHIWEKKGSTELLNAGLPLLRPANYPPGAPGRGSIILRKANAEWLVLNLQGREGMKPIDCPFRYADSFLAALADEEGAFGATEEPGLPRFVLVDFHAESFAEKQALGLHLDGRIAALAGTHTHVQTMDERILPNGSGYISDLGMCGPVDSIIGVRIDSCLKRNLTHMPIKMESAEGHSMINGALFEFAQDGRCLGIERVRLL